MCSIERDPRREAANSNLVRKSRLLRTTNQHVKPLPSHPVQKREPRQVTPLLISGANIVGGTEGGPGAARKGWPPMTSPVEMPIPVRPALTTPNERENLATRQLT